MRDCYNNYSYYKIYDDQEVSCSYACRQEVQAPTVHCIGTFVSQNHTDCSPVCRNAMLWHLVLCSCTSPNHFQVSLDVHTHEHVLSTYSQYTCVSNKLCINNTQSFLHLELESLLSLFSSLSSSSGRTHAGFLPLQSPDFRHLRYGLPDNVYP